MVISIPTWELLIKKVTLFNLESLLHYYTKGDFEPATLITVLNCQSPGVVSIAEAMLKVATDF
ncbi:hypothetical protein AG4045_018711 [Apium graveolens]|uniref:Uncharacterized protein n=1 Tax=Apium graveolens TaxID=4045 RepID=A0A6L5B7E3_APIGR|nr:hypothetical protein AG4045_018711 [Apium graveolens]